jgi:myo-inositol-1(or 4)-monophosphatase
MASHDLAAYAEFAMRVAQKAGEAILPHFRERIDVADKGGLGGYDPVTVADRDAEATIRAEIASAYPSHGLRGEEHGWRRGTSNLTWVIDPIDGTRSFILGQLHWATLIALHDGEQPLVGVVHQPYVGETFSAIAAGEARWQRGDQSRPLRTRSCARLEDAVLACTTPDMFLTDRTQAAFARVRDRVRFTRYGGDCYAYCMLAMGLIDVVVESSLEAYDIQALIPIVEAAGGVLTGWSGGACDEGGDVVACGDPSLHPRVLAALSG